MAGEMKMDIVRASGASVSTSEEGTISGELEVTVHSNRALVRYADTESWYHVPGEYHGSPQELADAVSRDNRDEGGNRIPFSC